jgi:hypothetical protein
MGVTSFHKADAGYDTRLFGIVKPRERGVTLVVMHDLFDAYESIGLPRGGAGIDHGPVIDPPWNGIGFSIAVDERTIFSARDHRDFFALGKRLFAGEAVVYAHTLWEISVDLPHDVPIRYFDSLDAIEAEIAVGTLERPTMWHGDAIAWQWPQPNPDAGGPHALVSI